MRFEEIRGDDVTTKSKESLLKRLQRRAYRRAFVAANVGVQIATQLHALRTSRNLSQERLAEEIGMNQARISLMERPEYQNYNIKTLRRFAEFYDIALDVRFVSIKEHVNRIVGQSSQDLAPVAFEEEQETLLTKAPTERHVEKFSSQEGRQPLAASVQELTNKKPVVPALAEFAHG